MQYREKQGNYYLEVIYCDRIINSCGQFVIYPKDGPFIAKAYSDTLFNKYFDIRLYIKECAEKIYYFYPSDSEIDLTQNELVSNIPLHRIMMKGKEHGQTINAICFPYVLTMNSKELDSLCEEYKEKIVERKDFLRRVVPFWSVISYGGRHISRVLYRKIIETKCLIKEE